MAQMQTLTVGVHAPDGQFRTREFEAETAAKAIEAAATSLADNIRLGMGETLEMVFGAGPVGWHEQDNADQILAVIAVQWRQYPEGLWMEGRWIGGVDMPDEAMQARTLN